MLFCDYVMVNLVGKVAAKMHCEMSGQIRGETNQQKLDYSIESRIGERTNSFSCWNCKVYVYMTVRFLVRTSCAAENAQFNRTRGR